MQISIPIDKDFLVFAMIAGIWAMIGIITRTSVIYKARTEKARELMSMRLSELNDKTSDILPYFSPNATVITAMQFVEMLRSKESYCRVMNRLARDLRVDCEFKVKDGVIDVEVKGEKENE